MKIKDSIFWITGASSGIGKALALELNKQGARVILSARNEAKLELVKEACLHKENAQILKLDLDDYLKLDKLVPKAVSLFGEIDVLVNNGGISQRSLAIDTGIIIDTRIFKTNYFGTVALSKAILPYFVARKKGYFVVVTSVVGRIGTPLRSSYAAAKHALHGFFDSLRAEIKQDNIAVTIVCPGFVKTDVSKNALTGDGSKQGTMDKATENGLLPEQVAIRMIKAIKKEKQEVVIGGNLEKLSIYLKRFFPKLLARMVSKIDVT